MAIIPGWAELHNALRQLGWVDRPTLPPASFPESFPASFPTAALALVACPTDCWLRHWLASQAAHGPCLNARGRAKVQRLVAWGWTLRSCWPRPWSSSIEAWLGGRFYLGHASLFSDTAVHHSLISSRIGRHGSQLASWPQWIDAALRHVRQHRGRLLLAPGSTLAEVVEQCATTADVPFTKVCWSTTDDVVAWLEESLTSLCGPVEPTIAPPASLYVSPWIVPPSTQLDALPVQDRVSIALADRLLALSLRRGGKLEKLIQLRLANHEFPSGSVFVTLPTATVARPCPTLATPPACPTAAHAWLARGAVGWIVSGQPAASGGPLRHCQPGAAMRGSVQQLTASLPRQWSDLADCDDWPYLVHCTRGLSGPRPEESETSYRHRVWAQGEAVAWHPLETLAHICREGRLRGTARLTRTTERCVSFSAVPLVPLLNRRTFRLHLGRWDWEPYGLLIRRECLLSIGARPVIYGVESEFAELNNQDKPFFQPRWRKQKQVSATWAEEREWRILGQVDLRSLPNWAILIFVRSQLEAQQFSRHSPWPILSVE